MSKYFPDHNISNIKNRFYSILKRTATEAMMEDPVRYGSSFVKSKENLIQFVDLALSHGHLLKSKKGRKSTAEKTKARNEGFLFSTSKIHEPDNERKQNERLKSYSKNKLTSTPPYPNSNYSMIPTEISKIDHQSL